MFLVGLLQGPGCTEGMFDAAYALHVQASKNRMATVIGELNTLY